MNKFISINKDAFSDGQIASKLWLCEEIERALSTKTHIENLWIYGSWYGVAALLLLSRNKTSVGHLHLFDIDDEALNVSKKFLNHWEIKGEPKLHFHRFDCQNLPEFLPNPTLVINTSCEHFESTKWWRNLPTGTFYAVQSTDMEHEEHISRVTSLEQFKTKLELNNKPLFEGIKRFDYGHFKFQRFFLLGQK